LKNRKKILLASKAFFPGNSPRSFRATELAKEFARQGYDVTILTVRKQGVHDDFEKQHGVKIRDFGPLKFPEISHRSGGRIQNLFNRLLRRILLQLFEYPRIELVGRVKKALEKESGYDLMISFAVPHQVHWGVALSKNKKHPVAGTWVADCGDPYMGQTLDSFNKLFYFKYFEKHFCRKADYITVPLEEAKEGYYPEFRDKIKVIPQGFDFNEVKIDPDAYKPNSVPSFAYAGSLFPDGRDPRAFIKYLLDQKKPFKFVLYTKSRGLIEPYLEQSGGKIEIRDTIPRHRLLHELAKMDFLVNVENASPLMMPSKLIDYYLAGRPVLNVSGTDLNKNIIDRFLAGDYSSAYRFENMERFRIETICSQFLKLIKE